MDESNTANERNVDSAEVTTLLERVREIVREEIEANEAKNAEAIRKANVGKYLDGINRAYRHSSGAEANEGANHV